MDEEQPLSMAQAAVEDRQIAHLEGRLATDNADAAEINRKTLTDPGDAMSAEMANVFDRVQADSARETKHNPEMPTVHGAKTFNDIAERAYEWHNDLTPAERRAEARAHATLEERRQEASRYGMSLEEYESVRTGATVGDIKQQTRAQPQSQAGQYALPPTFSEGIAAARELYPHDDPGQVLADYARIDRSLRTDPVNTIRWLAERAGLTPEHFGFQSPPPSQPEFVSTVEAVESFMAQHPEAKENEDQLLQVLNSPHFQKSADHHETLSRALDIIRSTSPHLFDERKAQARGKAAAARAAKPRSFQEEMAKVYDAVAR